MSTRKVDAAVRVLTGKHSRTAAMSREITDPIRKAVAEYAAGYEEPRLWATKLQDLVDRLYERDGGLLRMQTAVNKLKKATDACEELLDGVWEELFDLER